jgi:penicillin-binding protein 2
VLLAFALLAARQFCRSFAMTTRRQASRIAVVPVVPNRGLIVDRNGIVLLAIFGLHGRNRHRAPVHSNR